MKSDATIAANRHTASGAQLFSEGDTRHRAAQNQFDLLVRSGRPLVYITTSEERRVENALRDVCDNAHGSATPMSNAQSGWPLFVWDVATGLTSPTHDAHLPSQAASIDQCRVLSWFTGEYTPPREDAAAILIVKDFDVLMGGSSGHGRGPLETATVRMLANFADRCIGHRKVIVILAHSLCLPAEIARDTALISWPLPEPSTIRESLKHLLRLLGTDRTLASRFETAYEPMEIEEFARALSGLTLAEVEYVVTQLALDPTRSRLDVIALAGKKRDDVEKSGLLEWWDPIFDLDDVGGQEGLKRWIVKRGKGFTEAARAYGLDAPRGVLLLGPPGVGKSLTARAMARAWKIPLLRLDPGKIYGGVIGASEENTREIIRIAEAAAPCLLFVDEFEKGFAGSASGQHDGGTSSRVFGTILNWLQDRKAPVALVATSNDVSALPPEVLRKERFDEIFYLELPDAVGRREIFRIHLARRNRVPEAFDLAALADATDRFSGAEISALITEAMYDAFAEGCEVTTDDILRASRRVIPLAVTMRERIDALRTWAASRARLASEPGDFEDIERRVMGARAIAGDARSARADAKSSLCVAPGAEKANDASDAGEMSDTRDTHDMSDGLLDFTDLLNP